MDSQSLQNALATLGLTTNAIALYNQSYTEGRSTVGRLASLVGMDRSSAHLAATQLRERGLLNEEVRGGRTYIWVKPPKDVMVLLKLRMNELASRYDALDEALPGLMAGYAPSSVLPVVQVFSGKQGLRQVSANILDEGGNEVLLMTNQSFEREVFEPGDHRDFIAERLRRKLPIRVLAVDTPEAHDLIKTDAQHLRQTRIITDESAIPFRSETYIYGNSVAMLSYSGQVFGFITRSADFADAQRWMFERLWRELA